MSTETLNRLIKEVNALTPQERRELIDRLTHEEQTSQGTVKHMAPDFDDSALSRLSTHQELNTADPGVLRDWLNEARNMRSELPQTVSR